MQVAMLAVDGMLDSGATAVLDILSTANALSGQIGLPEPPFSVTPVGIGHEVRTAQGFVWATTPFDRLNTRPDVVVSPALGFRPPDAVVDTVRDHDALTVIAKFCADGVSMAAACSAAFFLGEAGILDGLTVTTSWWLGPAFRARYPRAHLDETKALAVTENITTAGAGFAHIDLGMSLVTRVSPALADLVSRYLVVGDRPAYGGIALPSLVNGGDPTMSAFERHVRDHLATPLSIGEIARSIGVSERTLHRACVAAMGMPPTRFVQEVRLDQAAYLLRMTNLPPAAIARAVGYLDVGTLRTLVRERRGSTLGALRRQTVPG